MSIDLPNNQINSKLSKAMDDLLSRQDYLVVQGNDLAKAFGNLTSFQHKVLDYCFSFVTKQSHINDEFQASALDIIHHLGIAANGQNYQRVAKAFKALNERTALYLHIQRADGTQGIMMTQLFSHISFYEDGKINFKFGEDAAPYVYELRKNFYSFKLRELANIKSKYSLIMMKLWQANKMGNQADVTIKGSMESWQSWFLGDHKRLPAKQFKQRMLNVATNELGKKLGCWFLVKSIKDGRKIVGYEISIHERDSKRP
uniref:replication initiation protein n=1 Tax=Lentilactobacillus hilgardii TaxID=1588 RepID=UPI00403F46D8